MGLQKEKNGWGETAPSVLFDHISIYKFPSKSEEQILIGDKTYL